MSRSGSRDVPIDEFNKHVHEIVNVYQAFIGIRQPVNTSEKLNTKIGSQSRYQYNSQQLPVTLVLQRSMNFVYPCITFLPTALARKVMQSP